jgi:Carboxypeptidase regulatory-like domain
MMRIRSDRTPRPRRGIVVLLAVLAVLISASSRAFAQEDAGIIGVVTDESGALLPGVAVTVTSPALQVPSMTSVTDAKGEFRITPLPIGSYTVEYSLSGFQGVKREGVRLTVGFTAKVDAQLKVGALEETITVSGASPVVDVKSTTTTTQLTRETIELLPSSRNGIVSILAQAPGVRTLRDVGGSTLNQVPTYRVFGQAGEPFTTLDGVWTSSLQSSGGQANYWDYTAIEEAAVKTLGNGADVPSRGINLAAVVKSGGNQFHGSGYTNYTGKNLQSDNIDATLQAQGITVSDLVDKRYSYSGDLGGRIIKDTLWFYTGARRATDNHVPLNTFMPDGVTPAVAPELAWFQTVKLSYQMSPSNKFSGFRMYNHKYDTSNLSQFIPWNSRGGLTTFDDTEKIEWQHTQGNSLVTSVQYGFWQYHSHYWTFAPPGTPTTIDQITRQQTGAVGTPGQRPYNPRHHIKASATWYKPDLFAGNHEFKFGADYAYSGFGRRYPALDPNTQEPDGAYSSAATYNYQLIYRNGVPFNMAVYNSPANAWVVSHYTDLYFQDGWSLGPRLTVNAGVRYAHDNGSIPASCTQTAFSPADQTYPAACYAKQQFNVWNPIVPRIYASYDIGGNGKTVIKGGYGRFAHQRMHDPELNNADPQVRTTTTYTWHDLNGNRLYDPGEVNFALNGADFRSQSGGSNQVVNPNEKEPFANEVSVTLERELVANLAIRLSAVHSTTDSYRFANNLRPYSSYNIAVTNADPGPDGVVGTADDAGLGLPPVVYYEYPTALNGRAFEQYTLTNDPKAEQKFNSIDISGFKRFSNNWEFLAGYSATKRNVPVSPILILGSVITAATQEFNSTTLVGDVNPNAEINTADKQWEWTWKVTGAYRFPLEIMSSVNYEHRGGYPWARTVNATGGKTITSLVVNVEPIGARRMPGTDQVDVRLEKAIKVTGEQKVSLRMNVFNLLNKNTVTDLNRQSSATFGLPTAILPPRLVEFSASYSF